MKNGNEISGKNPAQDPAEVAGGNPLPLRPDEVSYDLSDMGDAPLLAVLEESDPDLADDSAADRSGATPPTPGDSETLAPDQGPLKNDPPEGENAPEKKEAPEEAGEDKKPKAQAEDSDAAAPDHATAASLMALATALLTGKAAPDELLPLLEAARAKEEIDRLRAEIDRARREGEIAGRNALIEERLVIPPVGVPDLNGTPARNSAPASIFDLARHAR